MNEKTIYPDWGAFGTANESSALEKKSKVVANTGDCTVEMKITMGKIEIKTIPTDTPEQIEAAIRTAHEIDEKKVKESQVAIKRLGRDLLDAIVDRALKAATAPDDYQSVFEEIAKMAAGPDRPAPLVGEATAEGIPYRRNGKVDHFTRRALKGRMNTRRKARPTPTSADQW